MMARSRCGIWIVAMILGLSAILLAGAASVAQFAAAGADAAWSKRLEALRPQNPLAYFELGEEISDAASDQAQRDLARHLFGLAGALDPQRLGRSACLALADMEERPARKRRLQALAMLLDAASGAPMWQSSLGRSGQSARPTNAAALAAAEALSHYRQGRGAQAQTALRTPGATELLQRFDHALPGGFNRFIEDCKAYRGQTKPALTSADITKLLELEAALLADDERTWSADLLLTGGQPLVEVDPVRLEQSLGVDASRPIYRAGRWVER